MALPAGLNKAAGMRDALATLKLSPDQAVGVGDAENDLDFLTLCGYPVAVANALPSVKQRVHTVTHGSRGEGVAELIEQLTASDCLRTKKLQER